MKPKIDTENERNMLNGQWDTLYFIIAKLTTFMLLILLF